MSSNRNTVKGHGIAVGDVIKFYGSDEVPTSGYDMVKVSKDGALYVYTVSEGRYAGQVVARLGAAKKIWAAPVEAVTGDDVKACTVAGCKSGQPGVMLLKIATGPSGKYTNDSVFCGQCWPHWEHSTLLGNVIESIRLTPEVPTAEPSKDVELSVGMIVKWDKWPHRHGVIKHVGNDTVSIDVHSLSDDQYGRMFHKRELIDEIMLGVATVRTMPSEPIKAVTFDDVKQANGWMSTDVDAVTRTLPAGTEVKPGFWNCCQAKPVIAVEFTSEETGEGVYYQGCRSCASTVPAERLAKLPFCDDGKCDSCDDCRKVAAVVESNLSVSQEAMAEAELEERLSAGVPVVAVLTGEQITALRESALLIAYKTAARHDGQMQLTRAFKATVRKFNTQYGHSCRTWADVRAVLVAAGVKGVKL